MVKKILKQIESKFIKFLSLINVTLASKYLFFRSQKKLLNLKEPKTFNEKLMWLKLNKYNENETVWKCSDKYLVRKYAKENGIKEQNLPELIGVYSCVDEIDFDKLPNKFVLKCTHGCGFNIICTNKEELNITDTLKKLNKWQKTKFGYESAEVHYTHIKPKIICEKFMDNNDALPYDYKLYCFNGKVKVILVCSEREKKLRLNFYDSKWNELMIGREKNRNIKGVVKPKRLKDMIDMAEMLSQSFEFVRIDFYEYNGEAILGEMTFTPASCTASYYSDDGQLYLGNLLDLNKN